MTVAAGIETALEVWELTLPEDEAGCQNPGCKRAATWAIINSPCGHSWQVCHPHHLAEQALRLRSYPGQHWSCNACGVTTPTARHEPI